MSNRVHPQFSRDLYNQYDTFGKKVGKSFLVQAGYEIINEAEGYSSHDLIVRKGNTTKKVEVEVTNCWKYDAFPYPTHHISYRKRVSGADVFIQINQRGTAIAVCDMSAVLNSPVIRKNCKMPDGRMTYDEPFFAIPVSMVRYYYCQDGIWYEDED